MFLLYFYNMHDINLREKKVRPKYGLFKQNEWFYRISSYHEKRMLNNSNKPFLNQWEPIGLSKLIYLFQYFSQWAFSKQVSTFSLENTVLFWKILNFFFFFFDILLPFEKIFPGNIQLFRNSYWKYLDLRKMCLIFYLHFYK